MPAMQEQLPVLSSQGFRSPYPTPLYRLVRFTSFAAVRLPPRSKWRNFPSKLHSTQNQAPKGVQRVISETLASGMKRGSHRDVFTAISEITSWTPKPDENLKTTGKTQAKQSKAV